jgi:DASS family divalent anion:Na+ symporter
MMKARLWKIGVCILVPVIILSFPIPEGLSKNAWQLLAVYLSAICGLIFRPFDEPAVLLAVIAAAGLTLGGMGGLLSGFGSTTAWLVFAAFMIGTAFVTTGLGKRIAFTLIDKFGQTTLRLGYVAAVTDLIISPATPSNTARTGGIVYPIFQNISVALDSLPGATARRVGAYLIMVLYHVSFTTGYTFLTAIAPNVLILSFAQSVLGFKADWIMWATISTLPGLVNVFLIPWVIYKIYPPDLKHIDNKAISKEHLAKMGPMTLQEKYLSCYLFWPSSAGLWVLI